MKQEHIFGIIIVCLFVSTVYVSILYVQTLNEFKSAKTSLYIYEKIAMEYWATEQLIDFLNITITHINMITHFKYEVILSNGTSRTFRKYNQGWHID